MSKELDLLQYELKVGNVIFVRTTTEQTIKSALERKDQLETENAELKARNEKLKNILDIIKERNVDILTLMHADTLWDYKIDLLKSNIHTDLTETEFNLLKEMLK